MTNSFLEKIERYFFKTPMQTRLVLFICGAIYPLAFSPFDFWPLIFISIIPLLLAIIKSPGLSGFKIGYYWGLGCFAVGASWVYVSIHEFGFVPVPGAILLTFVFIAFLALFKGLFGYLLTKLLRLTSPAMLVLIAPCIWLLSEFLQSVVFSGFPWLLAGYSQIDSPMSSLASWFGVYGISWFVVAISAAITLLLITKNIASSSAILVILFSIVMLADFIPKPIIQNEFNAKNASIDVALVQPNIAQEKKWDRRYFNQIMNILTEETKQLWGADLIIWPEGAIPAYVHQVDDIVQDISQMAVKNNSHVIFGIPEYDHEKELSYVALKAYGETPQSYHKQVLVPFGEYVPLQSWLRGVIQFLDLPMSNFSTALTVQKPMQFANFSVLPAICYEIVYPSIIHQLSQQANNYNKPQVIVTVSNDAWFGDSLGPYQHMQMARMRALELGLPLVRSTNDGITAMVDVKGKIIKQLPRYEQGSLRSSISLNNIVTPYRQWGFSGILLILSVSCLFIGLSILKK